MDNRLQNLCLVPKSCRLPLLLETQRKHREQSLYWAAIQQLPPDHMVDEHFNDHSLSRRYYNANGELVYEEGLVRPAGIQQSIRRNTIYVI
ncbi:zinc finger MYND domain-containing protein 19-like isoform X3 [Tachypleus tridentatus]